MKKNVISLNVILIAASVSMAGCSKQSEADSPEDGPMEEAGEEIDEAAEELSEAAEEGVEDFGETADAAAEEVEDAIEQPSENDIDNEN